MFTLDASGNRCDWLAAVFIAQKEWLCSAIDRYRQRLYTVADKAMIDSETRLNSQWRHRSRCVSVGERRQEEKGSSWPTSEGRVAEVGNCCHNDDAVSPTSARLNLLLLCLLNRLSIWPFVSASLTLMSCLHWHLTQRTFRHDRRSRSLNHCFTLKADLCKRVVIKHREGNFYYSSCHIYFVQIRHYTRQYETKSNEQDYQQPKT